MLGPGDVALGISHSGTTADTIDTLQAAADRGATKVALTNFPRSPLAECSDRVLTTSVRETPLRSGATVSRIAQLALIDCLFVGVAQRSYERSTTALTDTYTAIHRRTVPHPTARRSTPRRLTSQQGRPNSPRERLTATRTCFRSGLRGFALRRDDHGVGRGDPF
ncbi:MurR/RpiR family transcriptional regulator [Streptomyces sp. NPDC058695]|uniref:MurR/RpiR family transcriptional regulator n=1 Tax=Streptomyces sp. NPDC058695 TaxID=3346604 RepID=UPI00366268A6